MHELWHRVQHHQAAAEGTPEQQHMYEADVHDVLCVVLRRQGFADLPGFDAILHPTYPVEHEKEPRLTDGVVVCVPGATSMYGGNGGIHPIDLRAQEAVLEIRQRQEGDESMPDLVDDEGDEQEFRTLMLHSPPTCTGS